MPRPSPLWWIDYVAFTILLSSAALLVGWMLGSANARQADYEARLAQDRLQGRVLDLSVDRIVNGKTGD